jgi:release factor glutamine methyltransferase
MPRYYGINIGLCDGVYEPDVDTFLLAENICVRKGENVLDMGTGTGLLGLIAAKAAREVLAVDINPLALRCANENALRNGISNMKFRLSDLFSNVSEAYDLIIFNPPYLPTEKGEPKDGRSLAWDGGADGRRVIDRFLESFVEHLFPGGRLITVACSLSGCERTIEILEDKNFKVSIRAAKKLDFEKLSLIRACL